MAAQSGYNPLLDDISMRCDSDLFLLKMIRVYPNINIANKDRNTPLHLAIKRDSMTVALGLIKKGADINAHGKFERTPLHLAVDDANMEAVCMLLYYNVDVSVVCRDNKVAFMDALDFERLEIARLLLNYHNDFPRCSFRNYTVLHIFSQNFSPIAVDLVNKGVDVNSVTSNGYSGITYSLEYPTPELFKLIWNRIDYSILFLTEVPFILIYIDRCQFAKPNWIDCFHLVLDCKVAFELIQHCISYIAQEAGQFFFEILLSSIKKLGMEVSEKIEIIYILLTLGVDAYISDVDWLIGNDSIEEAFLIAYFLTRSEDIDIDCKYALSPFLAVLEYSRCYKCNYIYYLYMKQISRQTCHCVLNCLVYSMGFFALPVNLKYLILEVCQLRDRPIYEMIAEKLAVVPEFPTLQEICRNRIRMVIKQNRHITKPYVFYDIVKKLLLPRVILELLTFKTPLYK